MYEGDRVRSTSKAGKPGARRDPSDREALANRAPAMQQL